MGRYLPLFLAIMLMIFCLVEVAQAPAAAVRLMPRWLWAVTVVLLPLVGAVCWLCFGRPTAASRGEADPQRRPPSPDDDPDFLRRL